MGRKEIRPEDIDPESIAWHEKWGEPRDLALHFVTGATGGAAEVLWTLVGQPRLVDGHEEFGWGMKALLLRIAGIGFGALLLEYLLGTDGAFADWGWDRDSVLPFLIGGNLASPFLGAMIANKWADWYDRNYPDD